MSYFNDYQQKPSILLVDKSMETLALLNKELKGDYVVLRTTNGEEAIDALNNNSIQLIVTDMILPKMDGITLCKQLKTNILYNHIPVVFLTPKTTLNMKIEVLKSGADAYIEKPFSLEYLKVQIKNILDNRLILGRYFANLPTLDMKERSMCANDEDFIDQLNAIIYNNISNMDLDVTELARLMNMSRPTLYRRIKKISNLTPNEMINRSKLKKAAELLSQRKYNISQVASIVGYSAQSNFSRDFNKYYGISPSAYSV